MATPLLHLPFPSPFPSSSSSPSPLSCPRAPSRSPSRAATSSSPAPPAALALPLPARPPRREPASPSSPATAPTSRPPGRRSHCATGADVAVYSADVQDEAAVREAIEAAGTIDVLVCNQGVSLTRPLIEQDKADARAQIDTNTLHLIKAALPGMKKAAVEDGTPRSIGLTASEGAQAGD